MRMSLCRVTYVRLCSWHFDAVPLLNYSKNLPAIAGRVPPCDFSPPNGVSPLARQERTRSEYDLTMTTTLTRPFGIEVRFIADVEEWKLRFAGGVVPATGDPTNKSNLIEVLEGILQARQCEGIPCPPILLKGSQTSADRVAPHHR